MRHKCPTLAQCLRSAHQLLRERRLVAGAGRGWAAVICHRPPQHSPPALEGDRCGPPIVAAQQPASIFDRVYRAAEAAAAVRAPIQRAAGVWRGTALNCNSPRASCIVNNLIVTLDVQCRSTVCPPAISWIAVWEFVHL